MKVKSFVCVAMAMLLLTGCGPKIQPPDDVIQQTPVISQPSQPEWRIASCTYELSTGEIGSFKAVTSDGIAKIYSAPTTIYDADGEFIAVSDFKLPDEMKEVNFSQEGVLDALLDEVKKKVGDGTYTLSSASETESVWEYASGEEEDAVKGLVGISRINSGMVFVQWVTYPATLSEDKIQTYQAMMDPFKSRVFVAAGTDTSTPDISNNPNEGVSRMYVPIGNGYDVLLKGSSAVVKTDRGYDIWTNRGVCASVESFNVGQTDLNLTEYNLNLTSYQKDLIPDADTLEFFKIAGTPSLFMDIENGFWSKISYTYMANPKYIEVYLMAVPSGFYTVTVHSNSALPSNFLTEMFVITSTEDRKTNGELADVKQAATVSGVDSDYIKPIHLSSGALAQLRTPSSEYLLENFGEARLSGSFMNKMLYYKDNFVHTLLPITSNMVADEGISDTSYSAVAPYGEQELPDAQRIELTYSMFSASAAVSDSDTTDASVYGFNEAINNVLKDVIGEMEENNIVYSTERSRTDASTFQQEFSYRYDDSIENLKYEKHVAVYIKNLGVDRYTGENIYFSALLVWGQRANSSQLATYQQAFESTVKQVP